MSIADTFEDSLGTWEVDAANERFVRKNADGEVNGEAPFDFVANDNQPAPEWFKEKLAEITAE
jgi:hypothetical protein